jgi:protein CpxP
MKVSCSKMSFVALAIVLMAGLAIAEPHGGPRGGGGDFFGGMMFDYLDLSDAQRAQIKQIMEKEKPTLEPLFKQEMESHKQMMQLVQSGFDEAKAQAIATQGAQIHAQLEVQHARVASEAYQVLTAEQKTKLAQFMAKREQRFEQHMQEREGAHSEDGPSQ